MEFLVHVEIDWPPDATAVHEAVSSLPLCPWMNVQVIPLAQHPNDPLMLGIVADAPEGGR